MCPVRRRGARFAGLIAASFALFMSASHAVSAPRYEAQKRIDHGTEIVELADGTRGERVAIVPSYGNRAYRFEVHGKNLLYFPFADPSALKVDATKGLNGIPFLAPWANRLSEGAFWANGKHYLLNSSLPDLRINADKIAIHGLLTSSSLWEIADLGADHNSAHVTSYLPFWKYPELMANWPFAHEYRITYTLRDGELEVKTEVTNRSAEPMPVSIGYHPYFNLPDAQRANSFIQIPARKHIETNKQLVATGEMTANDLPARISLRDHTFDDGFTDLVRDANGNAILSVESGKKRIQVIYGPKFRVALVYAPPGKEFVCFEPMTAITNALNLSHEGKYSEMESIGPGKTWTESFRIRYDGF